MTRWRTLLLLLLPILSALSCDSYPWYSQVTGTVTATSSMATDGTLKVEGTIDIVLTAWGGDTSFALDELRFSASSMPGVALEIESLEVPEQEWPVLVPVGRQESRIVKFKLRAPATDPPQTCPNTLSLEVAIKVLADSDVESPLLTFGTTHVCEGCSNPVAVDVPVAWQAQVANPLLEVRDIEVDPVGAVWAFGPKLDSSGFLAQAITSNSGFASLEIPAWGDAEIASGSLPGILLASTSQIGLGGGGADAGGAGVGGADVGGADEGGGPSGGGPASGSLSVRVARYDVHGVAAWNRDLAGSSVYRNLAAFSGYVLVGISSPEGLDIGGEVLAPNDYLVLLDEETGDVVRYSTGFVATAMAPTADGAVVLGWPSVAIDSPELRVLDADLQLVWSTEVGSDTSLYGEVAAAGDDFFVYDPAAGVVMKRSSESIFDWDASVPLGVTTLAAVPDGGVLLGGPGVALRLSAQGEATNLIHTEGEPSWCVGTGATFGFASAGLLPGFVVLDPSLTGLTVGRLEP